MARNDQFVPPHTPVERPLRSGLFEGRHRNLVLICIGYDTVGLAMAGAIVAAMG